MVGKVLFLSFPTKNILKNILVWGFVLISNAAVWRQNSLQIPWHAKLQQMPMGLFYNLLHKYVSKGKYRTYSVPLHIDALLAACFGHLLPRSCSGVIAWSPWEKPRKVSVADEFWELRRQLPLPSVPSRRGDPLPSRKASPGLRLQLVQVQKVYKWEL